MSKVNFKLEKVEYFKGIKNKSSIHKLGFLPPLLCNSLTFSVSIGTIISNKNFGIPIASLIF